MRSAFRECSWAISSCSPTSKTVLFAHFHEWFVHHRDLLDFTAQLGDKSDRVGGEPVLAQRVQPAPQPVGGDGHHTRQVKLAVIVGGRAGEHRMVIEDVRLNAMLADLPHRFRGGGHDVSEVGDEPVQQGHDLVRCPPGKVGGVIEGALPNICRK